MNKINAVTNYIIFQSNNRSLGKEILPGLIVESTGIIWNSAVIDEALPIVKSSYLNAFKII